MCIIVLITINPMSTSDNCPRSTLNRYKCITSSLSFKDVFVTVCFSKYALVLPGRLLRHVPENTVFFCGTFQMYTHFLRHTDILRVVAKLCKFDSN